MHEIIRKIIRTHGRAVWISLLLSLFVLMTSLAHAAQPANATATLLPNGQYLQSGGSDSKGSAIDSLSLYDATTQQAIALNFKLAVPRTGHTATVLPDGTVLILGGLGQDGHPAAAAEILDVAAQQTQLISSPGLIARSQHRATLLTDGKVLITGGLSTAGTPIPEAELWNPRTRMADTLRANLITARYNHLAQLLAASPVLIQGGQDASGKTLTSSEQYDTNTQRFNTADGVTVPDTLALPAVAEIIPPADGFDVAVDGWIVVRFNKPLKIDTLNTATVTLLGPNGLTPVKVVPTEAGMLLFVSPNQALLPASQYTLFINGATDSQGNPLPFIASSFRTASVNSNTNSGDLNGSLATGDTPASNGAVANGLVTSTSDNAVGIIAIDEDWIPTALNYKGEWKSGRADLAKAHPPKRVELQRAYMRTELERDGRLTVAKLEAKLPAIITPSAPAGVTALIGQALKLNGQPLAGVTLSMADQTTVTDANGEFILSNIPAGLNKVLTIDGSSADAGNRHYGRYYQRLHIEAGKVNALHQPVWMTKLDTRYAIRIPSPTTQEVVITNPKLPGLEIRIPAGVVIRDPAGKPVTQISLTPVPADQTPFPMPYGEVPVYYTLQPGGAVIQSVSGKPQGATVIYPNYSTQPHGARFELFDYDPYGRGWYIYTTAKVSADDKYIVGDKPFQLYQFSASSAASSGGTAAASGVKPNAGDCRADPVSCHEGLFFENGMDLSIKDTLAIDMARTYRQNDANQRSFGVGADHGLDMYLYFPLGADYGTTEIDVITSGSTRIPFTRTSNTTTYNDTATVYTSSTVPNEFYQAKITHPGGYGADFIVTLKDGRQYGFSYYVSRLKWIQDRYGNRISITRDGSNRISRITSPNGRYIDFTYTATGCTSCISTATDYTGRVVSYTYDSYGHLMTVTNPEGGVTSYTYDNSTHRMLTVRDPRNNVGEIAAPKVTNVYYSSADGTNLDGRVKSQTYADSTTSTFNYYFNTSNQLTYTDYKDERGVTERIFYNTNGYVTATTRALGQPEAQTINYSLDTVSNLTNSVTDALNRTTAYTYDANGNTTAITRMQGTAEATTWNYTYEPTYNQVTLSTDPLGRQIAYTYDSVGNLTDVKNLGNSTHVAMTYNAAGQVLSQTAYNGSIPLTSSYTYDGGDLTAITNPLGQSVLYFTDSLGRVAAVTDPLNNVSFIDYDKLDRVTKTTDPLSHVTQYSYDADSNLKTLTDANAHTTSYSYDPRNRVLTTTDPQAKVESYTYDAGGNRTRTTDRKGQITGTSYDYLNRVTQTGYGATSASPTAYTRTVAYTWDAGNRILQTNDSQAGLIQTSYDGYDRLTRETSPTGQIDYSYYTNGLRKTRTVLNQPTISYSYDNGNRPIAITQGANIVSYTYDSANRRTSLTLPNGITQSYTFDNASQLTGIAYTQGTASLGNLTYTYDAAGRRTQMGGTLASANLPQDMTASYDAANHITQFNSTAYSYDANGNLITDGQRNYTWDPANRLTQISGSSIASFQYDPYNRRTSKTINGNQTGYLYDGINPVQELAGSTPTANLLTGGVDEYLTRTTSNGSQSYMTDALGSTLALTDATGAINTQYSYEAYGNTTQSGTLSDNAFQYTGRENDGTGLYYYRARYYDSQSSRFISQDPIGFGGGVNQFGYVNGNPVSLVDPFGLDWQFSQSTGQWSHIDNQTGAITPVGPGYSGNGVGRNNPAMQDVPNVGPTPQGTYDIGPGHYSPNTGPNTMNLTPRPGTNTLRDLLRIHGDNATHNASHGCAIAGPNIRNQINNSSDRVLNVVP